MNTAAAIAVAVSFAWLGMVLAISFIEAPLKFRAPGVTLQIGLGIGRLVFRALNAVEVILGMAVLVAFALSPPPARALGPIMVAVAALLAQLLAVRPRLARRSRAVLTGENAPRSHAHYAYVVLESIKVVALLAGGGFLLAR